MNNSFSIHTDKPEGIGTAFNFGQRREKLRKLLRQRNLDAMLVMAPANRFYLSGFELHDSQCNETSGFIIVTANGKDWLATDARFEETAKKLWPQERIFIYRAPVAKDLARLLAKIGALIGVETEHVACSFLRQLKFWGAPPLLPADGMIERLRMIKNEEEIKALTKSFTLNHQLLAWLEGQLPDFARSCFSEKTIAWEIERYFRENGAQELAFSTIAAIGSNAAAPHAVPGENRLRNNESLLVDTGCRVDDYCSDQTRAWWVGDKPPEIFIKTLELVKKAQQTAMEIMRPGVLGKDIYTAALKVFEDAGVADKFTHGLGHGIGLQTHEAPSLNSRNNEPLRAGMVITVEPGLYYPEWGGIRWENTVLVVEDGIKIL